MRLISIAMVIALAGCNVVDSSTPAEAGGEAGADVAMAPAGTTEAVADSVAPAIVTDAGVTAPVADQPALQAPVASRFSPCPPASPDVYCSGPLIVRIGQPVLVKNGGAGRDGRQDVRVTADFTVESRSGGELLFNLAYQTVRLTLPIGTVLEANFYHDSVRSGVTPCRDARDACV